MTHRGYARRAAVDPLVFSGQANFTMQVLDCVFRRPLLAQQCGTSLGALPRRSLAVQLAVDLESNSARYVADFGQEAAESLGACQPKRIALLKRGWETREDCSAPHANG